MHKNINIENYIHKFQSNTDEYSLPEKFTYPFNYEPHPLCLIAASELQEHLKSQKKWYHDFGIDHPVEGSNIGKMFGIMIIQDLEGNLGYLQAFSGKLAGTNNLPGFVPPIYDLLDKNGFFRKEENEISQINTKIEDLLESPEFNTIQKDLLVKKKTAETELNDYKSFMKNKKADRNKIRQEKQSKLNSFEFEELKETLKQESLKYQFDFKQLKKHWKNEIEDTENKLQVFQSKIASFKDERKNRSAALQKKLFDQYQFLNFNRTEKSLIDIFDKTAQKIPPAGAGDCAAPKLLQFAYQNSLIPIAMAEFWWGQSPSSEVRKHGYFYPACKSKCEPILGHMLKGLDVDEKPVLTQDIEDHELTIIYEDEDIVVINKPADFLSVPGKETEDSVWLRMKKKYPEATGPLLVHRLDMSTSGLLLVAKNKEAHKILQKQFLERTIKKRYIALLDGIIHQPEGLIDLPLRVDLEDRPRQVVCYQYGKKAQTRYKTIVVRDNKTLVHFYPITGRTHQLRVHAAHAKGLNTPIVGDDLYGKKAKRLCLHAEYLEFTHPTKGTRMKLKVDCEF